MAKHFYRFSKFCQYFTKIRIVISDNYRSHIVIPYSSNKVDVTIVKRLRYLYVSNQFLNNLPLINCLPSLVEHKNNIVALLALKNSSTIAMTVALTFLSRGDFTPLRLPIINS